MHKHDIERIKFYGREDGAALHYLLKAERILKTEIKDDYPDLNEVIELYHIKKYIDNETFLINWTEKDISDFKEKANAYGKIVGRSMSKIDDSNIMEVYENLIFDLVDSFWELFNNQGLSKKIARPIFASILSKDPHSINDILNQKNIVDHYHQELREFLLVYENSARILLSVYEEQDTLRKSQTYIPRSLSASDKEKIIST